MRVVDEVVVENKRFIRHVNSRVSSRDLLGRSLTLPKVDRTIDIDISLAMMHRRHLHSRSLHIPLPHGLNVRSAFESHSKSL